MSPVLFRSQKDNTLIECKQDPGVFIPVVNRGRCEGQAECTAVCP